MLEHSLHVATVRGIRIGLHYTWFVIFALLSLSLHAVFRQEHPGWSEAVSVTTAVGTALLFFASVLLHELGHSLVALRLDVPVRAITLFIFGGVAQTERDADTPRAEFLIAAAGPLVSLLLAAGFALAAAPLAGPAAVACHWLASINLMLALFNLLPGFPLDGGRLFRALVWGWTRDPVRGMRWAVAAGRAIAFGLLGVGVLVVLTTGLLINGLWLGAIGWFLLTAAEASQRDFTVRRLLRHLRAADLMSAEVPVVDGRVSVEAWAGEYVLERGQRAWLVEHGGSIAGLVTLSDCRRVPRGEWSRTPVLTIMTPRESLHTVRPDAGVMDVLALLERHGLNQVPVVDGGRFLGWIDREALVRVIRLHLEVGR